MLFELNLNFYTKYAMQYSICKLIQNYLERLLSDVCNHEANDINGLNIDGIDTARCHESDAECPLCVP